MCAPIWVRTYIKEDAKHKAQRARIYISKGTRERNRQSKQPQLHPSCTTFLLDVSVFSRFFFSYSVVYVDDISPLWQLTGNASISPRREIIVKRIVRPREKASTCTRGFSPIAISHPSFPPAALFLYTSRSLILMSRSSRAMRLHQLGSTFDQTWTKKFFAMQKLLEFKFVG